MSDPLSVAASVAGLLSLGLQSTEYLYNYYTACRDQHQDLAKTADQLGSLLESVQIIDEIVRTRTWRPNEQPIIQSIEKSITHSEDAINGLQNEVDKFKNEPTDNWRKKAIVLGRQAAYPFKRSTLGVLSDDVSEFRGNLSIALQALQLKEHQNTQDDIEEVNAVVKDIQARSVSVDLWRWLKAPDATINFNIAVAKRHVSTGQWLVQGPAYTTWLQQDNSFLWLYGFAGCGKSVLCSTAIQHAFRRRQPSVDIAVAFFFFDFRDESKQDASAMLRALLLQLCGQVPGLESDMTQLKASYNYGTPPVHVLLEYLRQAVARCRHIYILLDALDESPEEISRSELLSAINTLRQWQLPGLHLLVTSRDVPDIRYHLQFPTLQQGVEHITLKNDSVQQDISRFVAFQVDHDHQLRCWGDHREKIKNYLTQHAGGVFRWVECQLRPLRQCLHSENHLEKCLRTLPQSLDETYERILCSIESREEARQILSLLCYASRPLSVDEVAEALAVDTDDLGCYDPRSKFTGGVDDVLRICPGLIDTSLRTDGVQILRIEHFSVQE
ncbi:NACHT domain-containing protein, partial [Cladophialophora immunda]